MSNIFANEATSGGVISSQGTGNILSRGVVWSTSQNPTISLSTKTTDSSGVGTFSSKLFGLSANTKYYVRAYATIASGTAYGNEVSFTTNDVNISDGLVAYYPFSGNAGDSSGNGNHGIVNGAILAADRFGKINSSYAFDGGGNNISAPHSNILNLEPKNSLTVAYWVKPRVLSQTRANIIISKQIGAGSTQKGWNSFIEPNFKTNFYIRNGVGQAYSGANYGLVSEGVFYYVTHTFDNGFVKVYLNGILQGEGTFSNVIIGDTDVPLLIGKASWASSLTKGFDGIIDDIRIYNRALTQSEITYLATH